LRRLILGPVLGLTAALGVAGCTPGHASTGPLSTGPLSTGSTSTGSTSASVRSPAAAITRAQAGRVFDAYVTATARAARTSDGPLALSVVTGVQRAVLAATLSSHTVVVPGPESSDDPGMYGSPLIIKPTYAQYSYGTPTFYLPEPAGYPRFFVADVTQALKGTTPRDGATTSVGGATIPADGPALMLFEQAAASAPWLLASVSELPSGVALPELATDSAGYIPTVPLSDASLLAQPDFTGSLQAAVVDDGPASAAARAVAAGPLTTGMYQGARDHVDGLGAPPGDVYQWDLEGSSLPQFALRTSGGGALTFYAMSLDTTVAVPDVINKADPIHSGPPIQVPADLLPLLPVGQPAPLIQLSSSQLLSFAAVDPATGDPASGTTKIQVIAIGGGLTSATAA
jgi:hypothetical protein